MGASTSGGRNGVPGVGDARRRRAFRVPGADVPRFEVVDALADSFPLLPGESQWLMALLADDLARILADD